ncbi:VWA domain-containing protein [Streptomyces sp. NPDC051776]|uniref:VWA domain-containing protein n=1 Tax=Streptomyces sp. NPDC051776 TaxID=3155414 RepID=UPI003437C066
MGIRSLLRNVFGRSRADRNEPTVPEARVAEPEARTEGSEAAASGPADETAAAAPVPAQPAGKTGTRKAAGKQEPSKDAKQPEPKTRRAAKDTEAEAESLLAAFDAAAAKPVQKQDLAPPEQAKGGAADVRPTPSWAAEPTAGTAAAADGGAGAGAGSGAASGADEGTGAGRSTGKDTATGENAGAGSARTEGTGAGGVAVPAQSAHEGQTEPGTPEGTRPEAAVPAQAKAAGEAPSTSVPAQASANEREAEQSSESRTETPKADAAPSVGIPQQPERDGAAEAKPEAESPAADDKAAKPARTAKTTKTARTAKTAKKTAGTSGGAKRTASTKAASDKAAPAKTAAAKPAKKAAGKPGAVAKAATAAKPAGDPAAAVSLATVEKSAPGLAGLYKAAAAALEAQKITGQLATVYLVLDRSGSMRRYYKDGTVQHLAEQAVALSANLGTGTVPLVFFSTDVDGTADISLDEYEDRIEALHADLGHMGRTNYHCAIEAVLAHREKSGATGPAFVIFQTDGAPTSKAAAEKALCDAAKLPVFWQFVGFGDPEAKGFDFLRKLDDLTVPERRPVANAAYAAAGEEPLELADEKLYAQVLAALPEWLKQAREAGILR